MGCRTVRFPPTLIFPKIGYSARKSQKLKSKFCLIKDCFVGFGVFELWWQKIQCHQNTKALNNTHQKLLKYLGH